MDDAATVACGSQATVSFAKNNIKTRVTNDRILLFLLFILSTILVRISIQFNAVLVTFMHPDCSDYRRVTVSYNSHIIVYYFCANRLRRMIAENRPHPIISQIKIKEN